jgi:hypothetical protein
MSELFDSLNKNSGALSALFSAVVTVATVVYAWLTAKLVQETRQMRQVQTEPRVQVTYRVSEAWINFLNISIGNIGLGPAYDITFSIKSEFESKGAAELLQKLNQLASFSRGLTYLGPAQEFSSFWTSLVEGDSSKVDSRFVITCTYRSVTGTSYSHDCIVDLSELKGSSRVGDPPLQTIAKYVEQLSKDVRQISQGRLDVDVYTSENRDSERRLNEERIQAMRGRGE